MAVGFPHHECCLLDFKQDGIDEQSSLIVQQMAWNSVAAPRGLQWSQPNKSVWKNRGNQWTSTWLHGSYFFWTQIFDYEPFRIMPVNRIDGSEPELERHWFEFSWKWSACRSHASKSQEQCTGRAAWGSSQRTCRGNAKMAMGQKLVQNSPRITEAWDFFLEDTTLLNGHNWGGRVTIPSHVVGH